MLKSVREFLAKWVGVPSNEIRRAAANYLRDTPALQAIPYWIAATVVGFTAVLYSDIFHRMASLPGQLARSHPYLLLTVSPVLFLFSGWMVRRFAPAACGSGIPQVMATLTMEGKGAVPGVSRLLGLRIAFIKVVSSIAALLGGGALGPEGPTVHISACLFHYIGNKFRRFWGELSDHSFIVAGGAAGVAAAFNTPLGGIVFAIEELMHEHFTRFRTYLITAVIISGMVAQWLLGPYLYFGYPKLPAVGLSFVPWAALVGAVCGLAGAIFGMLLHSGTEWMNRRSQSGRSAIIVACSFAVVGWAIYFAPETMGGGTEFIAGLLFEGKENTWMVSVGRFVAPLLTYFTGCAGGLFAPSLAAGASLGGQLALLGDPANANIMILLGMVGFLSSATRAPFTAFTLVIEMTDRHSAIFPMMVTALVSLLVANGIDKVGFYEKRRDICLTPPPTS